MKNWLRRKLRRFLDDGAIGSQVEAGLKVRPDEWDEDQLRFTLSPAIGGRILRVTRTVSRGGVNSIGGSSSETATYVIPTGDDVGERVTKIINLEMLK